MGVVEWLDVLDPPQLLLVFFNLLCDFGCVSGLDVEGGAEFVDLGFNAISFGHGVEEASEEGSFLGGDLCGWCVSCYCAIS